MNCYKYWNIQGFEGRIGPSVILLFHSNFNFKSVNKTFDYWNDFEGGVDYILEDNTDYWETVRIYEPALKKQAKMKINDYDSYLEYKGKNLGVNYVRFYFNKNVVYGLQFGMNITNDRIAKKDKYLKLLY